MLSRLQRNWPPSRDCIRADHTAWFCSDRVGRRGSEKLSSDAPCDLTVAEICSNDTIILLNWASLFANAPPIASTRAKPRAFKSGLQVLRLKALFLVRPEKAVPRPGGPAATFCPRLGKLQAAAGVRLEITK
jgi:hypothetical protein